jgi:hypothetical protein
MTYVVTPNSTQAPLNQTPQGLFATSYIQDPIVQQNFEILNKIISQILGGQLNPQANIVFGPAAAQSTPVVVTTTSTVITPGAFQAQITTGGNPVRVKLAPFQFFNPPVGGIVSYQGPAFAIFSNGAPPIFSIQAWCGWLRNGVQISETLIESAVTLTNAPTAPTNIALSVPLPIHEFEDVVPAGTYTYQFYFFLFPGTALSYKQLQVVAHELR